MRELGEVKDALDMEVKQNFIDPLQNLHEKDLKEIQVRVQKFDLQKPIILSVVSRSRIQIFGLLLQHHLKKMEGRRLDFDYKKKRQGKVTEDEIKQALEKFDDSKEIAEQSMFNLLESDVSVISLCLALARFFLSFWCFDSTSVINLLYSLALSTVAVTSYHNHSRLSSSNHGNEEEVLSANASLLNSLLSVATGCDCFASQLKLFIVSHVVKIIQIQPSGILFDPVC